MKEHFNAFMRTLRGAVMLLLSGMAAGAYLEYQYGYVPLRQDVASGWCGKLDHRSRYFEYNCVDAYIAQAMVQKDIEEDAIGAKITQVDAEQTPKAKRRK